MKKTATDVKNDDPKKEQTVLEKLLANPKYKHVGLLTEEEVESLRVKNNQKKGWINHIFVFEDENTIVHSYYKKADRFTIAKALSLYHQDKVFESGEALLMNCWIGGDERVKTDDDLYISTAVKLKDATQFHGGALEKI